MRRLVLLVCAVGTPATVAQQPLELPKPPSQAPITVNITPSQFTPPPASGQRVRVTYGTTVRSGPSDQSYPCCTLEQGATVELVAPPQPGSKYATITVPEQCHVLIPPKAVERFFKIKDFTKRYPILPKEGVFPLIDGDVPPGEDYLQSPVKLPHGDQVTILDVKVITIKGKRSDYYQIKSDFKGNRYVLYTDLEGVRPAEPNSFAPGSSQQSPAGSNFSQHQASQPPPPGPLTPFSTVPPATQVGEQESLPPAMEGQVRAAEQAYLNGVRHHAWEDARTRYLQLLDSDIPSVRILAINRLEFIRQGQADPQVVSARFPQQGTAHQAPPPPPVNSDIWIPGSQAPAPVTVKPNPTKPIKDVTIRPTPEPSPAPGTPTASPGGAGSIPVYTPPANTQPQNLPPQASIRREPPAGQLASTNIVVRKKATGRLYRATQNDGLNPLYYLANSQGGTTYYVRAWTNSRFNLATFEGKVVEVEGQLVDRRRDELAGYQINVETVRELR